MVYFQRLLSLFPFLNSHTTCTSDNMDNYLLYFLPCPHCVKGKSITHSCHCFLQALMKSMWIFIIVALRVIHTSSPVCGSNVKTPSWASVSHHSHHSQKRPVTKGFPIWTLTKDFAHEFHITASRTRKRTLIRIHLSEHSAYGMDIYQFK